MKCLDPLVVDVDEFQIVEVLQDEVRRIIVDASTLVPADRVEEHLESGAVKSVLARMDLVADVAAGVLVGVQDRLPAAGQLGEGAFDEAGRARRPWINERPGQRAGKGDAGLEPKVLRSLGAHAQLLDRPGVPLFRLAVNRWRCEGVEPLVENRIDRDELSLQVRGQFGDGNSLLASHAGDLIAIRLRRSGFCQIEQASIPTRDLHALVAETGGPSANRLPGIEGCGVTRKLCKKDRGSLHCASHRALRIFLVPINCIPSHESTPTDHQKVRRHRGSGIANVQRRSPG